MKLLFVYNANSGGMSTLRDSVHKLLSPKTYECNLCQITHGVFTEKPHWKRFKDASKIDMNFLHKDEFLKQYRSKWLPAYTFPIILSEENGRLEIFMATEVITALNDTSELIHEIEKRSWKD